MEFINQFLRGRPILMSANYTFLTLIPKSNSATEMGDFRPIFCINFIYNLKTKMLTDRNAG